MWCFRGDNFLILKSHDHKVKNPIKIHRLQKFAGGSLKNLKNSPVGLNSLVV
jgi:hypothetical protein